MYLFFMPRRSNFGEARVTESRVQNKINVFIFMPRRSNFDEVRVTEKRVQCNAKELAFLRSLPSDSNFGEARVTEKG